MRRLVFALPLIAAPLVSVSCSSDADLPPIVGANSGIASGSSIPKATALFERGQSQQAAGKLGAAAKSFGRVADHYPLSDVAPQARFTEAQLRDELGEPLKAFEAYQTFITRYRGSRQYAAAITRQEQVAQAAAAGEIKNSFLGLRSRVSSEKIVAMLEKVRDNAPQAPSASRSQFSIGELHQSRGEAAETIKAYQKLVTDYPGSREAPEGQYRIGAILTAEAEGGNQDRANLNRAREAYLDYIARYPNHANVGKARAAVAAIGSQSVQASYDTAEFYRKSGKTDSAIFYYKEVQRQQTGGPLREQATARLRELGAE
jgi:outer membrane protein assembly factor BamD (BamD/ComL family)